MATIKAKRKQPPQAVNRPFVVNAIGGSKRYGLTGGVTQLPLAVKVVGNDGLPPHDQAGDPVPLRIRFQTVNVPEGAEMNLVSGSLRQMSLRTDENGRASVGAQLGRVTGPYRFAVTLPDFDDGVDAEFAALTEGAVAVLQVAPVKATSVDRALAVAVKALDWQGVPVKGARLEASLLYSFQQSGARFFEAKPRRGGVYAFSIRSRIAGAIPLEIRDVKTDTRVRVPVTFLPGKARNLEVRATEDPREAPPFDQARLEVVAGDRFGNLVPDVTVKWEASSGRFEAVAHGPEVSAAAVYRFGKEPQVSVLASVAGHRAGTTLRLAGTYVRPAELKEFTFVGDPFKVWIEIFPPAGGGTARRFVACLREPVAASRRTGFALPNPENGVPEPYLVEGDDGRLDLCVDEMETPLPEWGGRLLVAELCYDCVQELPACFETLPGRIVIARSPDQERPLPPGFQKCPDQKRKDAKRLCLNICIPVKPGGGKTFDDLKREVTQQVKRTQDIFDENIAVCCPKIDVKACIKELPWAQYRPIFSGGEVKDALEQIDETAAANNDADKDKRPLSPEVKKLLKKCRKDKCLSVYYLPDHRFKSGNGWVQSNGASIPPNDFPETTGAAGSGPGIVLSQGLSLDDHTLAHELGHVLIDLPRDENGGDEHVDDGKASRVMKRSAPGGRKFTRDECRRIFTNIALYSGDCDAQ